MLTEKPAIRSLRAHLPGPVLFGAQAFYRWMFPPEIHYGQEYRRWLDLLRSTEFQSPEEHRDLQLTELQRLLEYSFEHVPYYREWSRQNRLSARDFRQLEDIAWLPFVSKEILRDRKAEFASQQWNRSGRYYTTTGGSTGIPFGFYRDNVSLAREAATLAHIWGEQGYRPWRDRCAVLRGLFNGNGRGHLWSYNPFRRELHLSTYALNEGNARAYLDQVRNYRVRFLQAYPSAATLFAKLLMPQGGTKGVFQAVFTASENLYQDQRAFLESAFGCPVVDFYGQSEQAALARQCTQSTSYHFLPQYGIVEFLGTDGRPVSSRGEVAEIVATGFVNRSTPMIRYRTRDLVTVGPGPCACGRNYPIAERIEGRLQELVVTPDGRRVSMTAINMHNDLFDRVLQFQFLQEQPENVILRVVPGASFTEADAARIRAEIGKKLGDSIDLSLELVERVDLGPSGKHRFLIQRIPMSQVGQEWC